MLYPEKESSVLELKREQPSKEQIAKTVVGFCNMYGGKLVLGVDDTRKIVGIAEEEVEPMIEMLCRSIHSSCTPDILPQVYSMRIQDKLVIIIEVSKGSKKPYFIKSKGIDQGTFIRFGTQTVLASPEIIQELMQQSRGIYPDEQPVYQAELGSLDDGDATQFFQARMQREKIHDLHEIYQHYKLTVREHNQVFPTVAGVLLFGKEPQRFLTESFIIGSHFEGVKGRSILATQDFSGTLFTQFHECFHFIKSRLNKEFTIGSDGIRKERIEIPEEAIREVLLNAIVHRHYGMPSPSKIAIFDDRLEIFSPGNFPGPIKKDPLVLGLTFLRNPVIGRAFRERGLIEKMGTGLMTLFQSFEERQLIRPILQEGVGFVKFILPRPLPRNKELLKLDQECLEIMRLFYFHEEIDAHTILATLDLSRSKVNRLLKQLTEGKFIQMTGKGKLTCYRRI